MADPLHALGAEGDGLASNTDDESGPARGDASRQHFKEKGFTLRRHATPGGATDRRDDCPCPRLPIVCRLLLPTGFTPGQIGQNGQIAVCRNILGQRLRIINILIYFGIRITICTVCRVSDLLTVLTGGMGLLIGQKISAVRMDIKAAPRFRHLAGLAHFR